MRIAKKKANSSFYDEDNDDDDDENDANFDSILSNPRNNKNLPEGLKNPLTLEAENWGVIAAVFTQTSQSTEDTLKNLQNLESAITRHFTPNSTQLKKEATIFFGSKLNSVKSFFESLCSEIKQFESRYTFSKTTIRTFVDLALPGERAKVAGIEKKERAAK